MQRAGIGRIPKRTPSSKSCAQQKLLFTRKPSNCNNICTNGSRQRVPVKTGKCASAVEYILNLLDLSTCLRVEQVSPKCMQGKGQRSLVAVRGAAGQQRAPINQAQLNSALLRAVISGNAAQIRNLIANRGDVTYSEAGVSVVSLADNSYKAKLTNAGKKTKLERKRSQSSSRSSCFTMMASKCCMMI